MNQARRLHPGDVQVFRHWLDYLWAYTIDGRYSARDYPSRQEARIAAQQEANRIGLERRTAEAIAAGRSKEKTVSGEILGALGLRPVPRTRVRTWVRR